MHQERRTNVLIEYILLGREDCVCLKVFGYEIVIQFVNL